MHDLSRAKSTLLSGEFTCVLVKEDVVFTSCKRGVKPLVEWLSSAQDFSGFCAADKVVGRATAFLYALLGVKAVYAGVVSMPALEVLNSHGIVAEYGECAQYISNRAGDGVCPFEKAVTSLQDKTEALAVILSKMKELNIN